MVLVIAAAALITGADWRLVAIMATVVAAPPWLPVALGSAWAIREAVVRRRDGSDVGAEAAFHTAVASELRSGGASLRTAISNAASDAPQLPLRRAARFASAGADATVLARELETALPVTGVPAAAAVELSATTGGRAAASFDALAERAAFEAELRREQRIFTAQARLSALVVGGGPLLVAAALLASGRARVLLDHGAPGITAGVVGLGLEIAGLVVVALLLRSHR